MLHLFFLISGPLRVPTPESSFHEIAVSRQEFHLFCEERHDDLGRVVGRFPRTFPATRADDTDLTVR
jgi:hypothetical protein